MAAHNRASRLARIGQGAATQFGRPPAGAKRRRADAGRRRFQGAFAESRLGRAGLNRLRARHTLRAAAACAAAATLALAGVALSRLERGGVVDAVALALSAALLAALAFALRPAGPARPPGRRRRGSAKRQAKPPPGAGRRGGAPKGAVPKDGRCANRLNPVEDGKRAKANGPGRKSGSGSGRILHRDRRGRFVSPRSRLARIANRRTLGRTCRGMRDAIFAKRRNLGAAAQDRRDADSAGWRACDTRSAGAEFERLCVGDQRHARTACATTAALALASAAAPLLAQASLTGLAGLIFGPAAAAMLAVALRSDWAAWQIGQERFADLAEYVRMRWLGRCPRPSRTETRGLGKATHHKVSGRKMPRA